MLTDIVANYLQFSKQQAKALLDLFTMEKCWQPNLLSAIKTQADLITYIQTGAQSSWFKALDASQLEDSHHPLEINNKYFTLFKELGLIEAFNITLNPDYMVLLGCFEAEVTNRIKFLAQNIVNNYLPTQQLVFGLGCARELGLSFDEHHSINRLKKLDLALTEINMINLLIMEELLRPGNKSKKVSYQPIRTSNENLNHVTTADTAVSLKNVIEVQSQFANLSRPISIAIYSNQPYILRQQRDIQATMGDQYNILGVGDALTLVDFNSNPKIINICLGEIARLLHINYTTAKMKNFAINLTATELEELRSLKPH
jgi:hypothetical protein